MEPHARSYRPIEPGLLHVFRLFVLLRFGLQAATFCSKTTFSGRATQRQYPVLGLLETSFLLVYLSWPWLRPRLGRVFLPAAVSVATVGPILEHVITVGLRLRAGDSAAAASADFWKLIAVLFAPLIVLSWQYGFRSVLIFVISAAWLQTLFGGLQTLRGGPRLVTVIGIVFVESVLYTLVGYLVARLAHAGRVQREELARMNAQLTQYATTVERLTVSHERNRLARELHDTLAHTLSAVAVQLEALAALWESDPAAARATLARAQTLTRDGLAESRRALTALRARPLEDLGLTLAVQQIADQGAQRAGLVLNADIAQNLGTLRPEVEQSVYRIAEEAVANTVRHANAHTLSVRLTRRGALVLEIGDDGAGFDPEVQRENGRYGLVGMQERAALCGGALTVSSRPGQGTTVRLTVEERSL